VLSALAEDGEGGLEFKHLATSGMPTSGTTEELMDAAGISTRHITEAVRALSNH
jgi:transketolase